ncbi:MAG: hypothetical protein ACHQF0_12620, partial [Chitinophagales bacterium]
YTTWTATKLEQITGGDERTIIAPTKGKKANQKEMIAKVDEGTKDDNWQNFHNRALWFVTL